MKEDYEKNISYILDETDKVYYSDNISNQNRYHYAPGKILAFYKSTDNEDSKIYAITQCCEYKHTTSSVISTRWKMEKFGDQPNIQMIDVDSIVRHVLMIPESDDNMYYHEIWDRERWADQFY